MGTVVHLLLMRYDYPHILYLQCWHVAPPLLLCTCTLIYAVNVPKSHSYTWLQHTCSCTMSRFQHVAPLLIHICTCTRSCHCILFPYLIPPHPIHIHRSSVPTVPVSKGKSNQDPISLFSAMQRPAPHMYVHIIILCVPLFIPNICSLVCGQPPWAGLLFWACPVHAPLSQLMVS